MRGNKFSTLKGEDIGGATSSRAPNKKSPLNQAAFKFCTQGRDRTGTVLLPLVFETSASTNSATWAIKAKNFCGGEYTPIPYFMQKVF